MANGGKRPGAGRPKGSKSGKTLEKEAARELVRRMVTEALQPLVSAQIENAKGLRYLVVREKKTGKFLRVGEARAKMAKGEELIEVWEKDPNTSAFADLLNRALDKPKEQPFDVNVTDAGSILSKLEAGRKRVAAARGDA